MTTLLILTWITLGDLWAVFLLPPEKPEDVTRIEIRNHRGESIRIEPQKPHRCTIKEDEHVNIAWKCTGPAEIIYRPRREDDAYFWVGGSNETNGFSGGIVGGGWRIVR
jgi:hypothetical protein